jgi:hypothetical protein
MVVTKQSQSEMATPFGLATTSFWDLGGLHNES